MTVAAADRHGNYSEGREAYYKMIDNDIIYVDTMVMTDLGHATNSGYMAPASDTQFGVFLGVAREHCDNTGTGHAIGLVEGKVRKNGEFDFVYNGTATQANIGDEVYIVDDQTVGTASDCKFCIPAGKITALANSAGTLVRVRIDDAVDLFPSIRKFAVAASTSIDRLDIVAENDAGYATFGAKAANMIALGIAVRAVDNSTGSAGAKYVEVIQHGRIVKLVGTQATSAYTIGDRMFMDGDNDVDLAAGTSAVDAYIGRVAGLVATNDVYVELDVRTGTSA